MFKLLVPYGVNHPHNVRGPESTCGRGTSNYKGHE